MERRLTLQIFSRCGIRVAVVANEQSVERIAYRPCSVRSGKFEAGSIECRPARTATALRERGMEALRQRRQRAATIAQQGGIKLRSEREVVIVVGDVQATALCIEREFELAVSERLAIRQIGRA